MHLVSVKTRGGCLGATYDASYVATRRRSLCRGRARGETSIKAEYMTSRSKLTTMSLENQVYEAIRDDIIKGVLRPGDTVVESQLSDRFGVSKTPVREALIRLKRDGLVEAALHRVNRVATPTAADIRAACEVRTWIECALAARCAAERSPELLAELEASIGAAREALDRDDVDGYVDAVRRFSDLIVEHSNNRYAEEALERLRNVLSLIAHIARKTEGRRQRSIDEHLAIFEAIKAGDDDAAAQATKVHLRSIEQDSLRALDGLELVS